MGLLDHTHDGINSQQLGKVQSWTPVLNTGGTPNHAGGGTRGWYRVQDKWVQAYGLFVLDVTSGAGVWTVDLPLPCADGTGDFVGTYWMQSTGVTGVNNGGPLPLTSNGSPGPKANLWGSSGNSQLSGVIAATVLFWFNLSYRTT